MKKRSKIALSIFAAFYIGFGALISINQEKIIYQPWSQDFESCVAFEDAEKINHNGTRMYVKSGKRGTVILYHGNAGSACDRDYLVDVFSSAGYGYIIPEYAGYSDDPKPPSHERIKKDVANVISYLNAWKEGDVVVVGESIGTGIASYHISLKHPDKVLLISSFYSLVDIAKRRFWFYPTRLLVNNAFDNSELLKDYTGPITILHGTHDAIIPYKSGLKLFESLLSKDKNLESIIGYGHNNLFTAESTYTVIREFLR